MASRRRRRAAARPPRVPEPQEPEELVPELEPWDEADEGPVRVSHAESSGEDVDLLIEVEVPEMPKAEVLEAIRAPLRRAVEELGERLRWRRVRVLFTGEALIPSAAEQALGELLGNSRPRSVVMERGFGDEPVLENTPPRARVETEEDGSTLRVSIDTEAVEEADLPEALREPLAELVARARAKTVRIQARGAAARSATLVELLSTHEFAAAASRVELAVDDEPPRVVRDAALEGLVEIDASAEDRVEVAVREATDAGRLREALELAAGHRSESLRAPELRVTLPAAATVDHLAVLEEFAGQVGAATLRVTDPKGVDLVLPRAIRRAERAGEIVLEVRAAGRDDEALRRALGREVAALEGELRGRPVVVDWTDRTEVDPSLGEPFLAAEPARLAWTFSGREREPVLPPPFAVRGDGEAVEIVLDTEAGSPKELAVAVSKRLAAAIPSGARRARIRVEGGGATTRRLVATLVESARTAGLEGLSIQESGVEDVLLPPALEAEGERIVARRGGRDDAALERALARELDAFEVEGASVRVAGDAAEQLVDALATRGVGRVVLEAEAGEVQVWPRLFGEPVREGEEALVSARPAEDESTTSAQLERELPGMLEALGDLAGARVTLRWPGAGATGSGAATAAIQAFAEAGASEVWLDDGSKPRRVHPPPPAVQVLGKRDEGEHPMTMLAVEAAAGEERVAEALAGMRADLEGRRVLLAFRSEGREVAARDEHPVVRAARRALEPAVAAILVLRGPRAGHGPHFEVVASRIEGLAVGKRFADPRTRPAQEPERGDQPPETT